MLSLNGDEAGPDTSGFFDSGAQSSADPPRTRHKSLVGKTVKLSSPSAEIGDEGRDQPPLRNSSVPQPPPPPAPEQTRAAHSFNDLLLALGEVHDGEVSALHEEILSLRRQLHTEKGPQTHLAMNSQGSLPTFANGVLHCDENGEPVTPRATTGSPSFIPGTSASLHIVQDLATHSRRRGRLSVDADVPVDCHEGTSLSDIQVEWTNHGDRSLRAGKNGVKAKLVKGVSDASMATTGSSIDSGLCVAESPPIMEETNGQYVEQTLLAEILPLRKAVVHDSPVDVEVEVGRTQRYELKRTWARWEKCAGESGISSAYQRKSYEAKKTKQSKKNDALSAILAKEDPKGGLSRRSLCSILCSAIILDPSSFPRILWDLAGAMLLCFDLVMIPMSAFGPARGLFSIIVDFVTLSFWTLDMGFSCVTGYVDKGITIMSPSLIAINYLRTWFALDVLVVVPDWVSLYMEFSETGSFTSSNGTNAGGLLRVLRIVRLARLLRLAKFKRLMAMMKDRIDSETTFIIANIVKLIILLLAVNHFLAAIWYAIGDMARTLGAPNWIDHTGQDFVNAALGYRYATSLHWSLTQFTPASMSVQPHNMAERTFAIGVLVFGMVLFSSFVSNITASMTQLRNMQDDRSKQFWLLRRYLRQHKIQAHLSFRILRYVEYACRDQKDYVPESKIHVLKNLSTQLRNELLCVVSFSCLKEHAFFKKLAQFSDMTMQRLASSALSQLNLASDDLLFNEGTYASHMYIIDEGALMYVRAGPTTSHLSKRGQPLFKHDCLCEAALWTDWKHLGTSTATTECKLVSVDVNVFDKVVSQEHLAWEVTAQYATDYVDWLNQIVDESQMSDLMTRAPRTSVEDAGATTRKLDKPIGMGSSTTLRSFTKSHSCQMWFGRSKQENKPGPHFEEGIYEEEAR